MHRRCIVSAGVSNGLLCSLGNSVCHYNNAAVSQSEAEKGCKVRSPLGHPRDGYALGSYACSGGDGQEGLLGKTRFQCIGPADVR